MNQDPLGEIRPIADDEVELMRTWRNASGVRANMYTQHEISTEEHLAWWQRTCQNPGHQYFMYVYNAAPTGIASLNGIDRDSRCSSWAFYVSPDAPRGSGSRLEFLMLDHAFGTLGLNKLHCEVLAFNATVIKMHQKFGFREEGIFRQQYKSGDRFVDIHRLGILAEEWNAMRQDMHERLLSYERK